ncbi:MAG: fimbrillin family protein [Bacteroidales bacterium]|nr:fimbrillin family protein [Bacteroidales bacterium]
MRKKNISLAALGSCILLASCSHNHIDEVVPANSSVQATFSGSINQMTRVSGTSWEANDAIGIFMLQNGTTNLTGDVANVEYVTNGDGTFAASNADASIYYPVNKSKVDFVAYYPYSTLSGTANDPTFVISNWNGVAHNKLDLLVAKSTAHNVTNPEVAFDFYHQFSKLELNLSADTETGLSDADLAGVKVRIAGINRPATFHFVDQTVSYATALDEDVFMQVAANGLSASAIIPSVKGSEIIFVLANGDSYTWDISSLSFESGKCYTYSIALKANPIAVEAQLTSVINDWNTVQGGLISIDQDADTGNTSDPTSGNESGNSTDANGYDYVDLGLTSGLLWATKNVGANLMTDNGSYFAWGETVGYAKGTSHNFSTSTYKWYKTTTETTVDNDGNTVTTPTTGYTKYIPQSSAASYGYEGFYDDKKVLETADDAAAANWGGDWRMPTSAEWNELRSQCTWTWLALNGVNGYKVESKTNGNYIFLPAASY